MRDGDAVGLEERSEGDEDAGDGEEVGSEEEEEEAVERWVDCVNCCFTVRSAAGGTTGHAGLRGA